MTDVDPNPPITLPDPRESRGYLVSYQRHWDQEVVIETFVSTLDEITEIAKKAADWGGMIWTYTPNKAGQLLLVDIQGEVEDLFR